MQQECYAGIYLLQTLRSFISPFSASTAHGNHIPTWSALPSNTHSQLRAKVLVQKSYTPSINNILWCIGVLQDCILETHRQSPLPVCEFIPMYVCVPSVLA